jgi:hypothetical protein
MNLACRGLLGCVCETGCWQCATTENSILQSGDLSCVIGTCHVFCWQQLTDDKLKRIGLTQPLWRSLQGHSDNSPTTNIS